MIRYNNLKIFIFANNAKPGGNIGAMLAPYLFSNMMLNFCKEFNEFTVDFNDDILLNVKLFVDTFDKSFSFFINLPSIPLIFNFFFKRRIFSILKLYDVLRYASYYYNFTIRKSLRVVLGILRSFKKKRILFKFYSLKKKFK